MSPRPAPPRPPPSPPPLPPARSSAATPLLTATPRLRSYESIAPRASAPPSSRLRVQIAGLVPPTSAFVTALTTTLVFTAHTQITTPLSASHLAPWLPSALLIPLAATPRLYAAAGGDARMPFLLALSLFTAGTLCASFSDTLLHLLFSLALTGAGAAGLHAPALRTGGTSYTLICTAGAVLGALLPAHVGWRWTLLTQLVPCLLLSAACVALPPSTARARPASSPRPAALLALSLAAAVTALTFGGTVTPWSSPALVFTVLVAAGALVLCAGCSHSVLPPPSLLHAGVFLSAVAAAGTALCVPVRLTAVQLLAPPAAAVEMVALVGAAAAGALGGARASPAAALSAGAVTLTAGLALHAASGYGLLLWAFATGIAVSGVVRSCRNIAALAALGAVVGVAPVGAFVNAGVLRLLASHPHLAWSVTRRVAAVLDLPDHVAPLVVHAYADALRRAELAMVACAVAAAVMVGVAEWRGERPDDAEDEDVVVVVSVVRAKKHTEGAHV